MTDIPSLATTVSLDAVGTVAVVDLEAACELYGRDGLPYPLGRSRPVGSVWLATRDVEPVEDRLHDGAELGDVRAWVEAFVRADVCVECRVSFADEGIPDVRLHGLQSGELGFVAAQHRNADGVDIVDIYAVSPGALGTVIADSVGLVGAGDHARIAVADGMDLPPASLGIVGQYDSFGFPVPHTGPGDQAVRAVDERGVVATGIVQARCDPARNSGDHPERRVLQWVQVGGDGDYIYAPDDTGYAEPLEAETLRARIDGLIADDLAVVRERRGQT